MDKYSLFNERKAAQAAAYLLCKAGGSLNVLKLVKLMYLAERESLRRYGETITGDALVSMRNGPVLSATLDHINGLVPSCQDGWDSLIDDRENHVVQLRNRDAIADPDEDLLALSECDAECLATVWDRFGHMSKWQLVDYTHSPECPEWEDPGTVSYTHLTLPTTPYV